MKKILATVLCLLMAGSIFVGCGEEAPEVDEPVVDEPVVEDVEVVPEEVPEAKYYFSFDDATGLTPVTQVAKAADSTNDGATYDIAEVEAEVLFSNGPVGQCLYGNGQWGYKLDIEALDTDAYSISFWLNADRLSTYGPTLQVGRNMGRADTSEATVAWINFTKSTWGANGADIFPVVWNRNSEVGVFPWVYAADDAVHGKREWIMVTLVCSGERYTYAEDGLDRIGCKFYLNGELAFDASAELALYGGISPEVLTGDGVEGYLGVNYWDAIYKGYFDELYIFDVALTDGQVLSLFEEGDINVESVAPEYSDLVLEETSGSDAVAEPAMNPATAHDVAAKNADAIDYVGMQDMSNTWWTDWSNSYAIADGETKTIKFENYSNGGTNWNNYVVGFANSEIAGHFVPADQFPGTYAEYAMVRADAFGWGDAEYTQYFETSWGDDWATWLAAMADADVTIAITRSGNQLLLNATIIGADGVEYTSYSEIGSTLTADAPCYFFITCEGCYIDILSVE